eukprot:3220010-Prymnesium_polylepis.1
MYVELRRTMHQIDAAGTRWRLSGLSLAMQALILLGRGTLSAPRATARARERGGHGPSVHDPLTRARARLAELEDLAHRGTARARTHALGGAWALWASLFRAGRKDAADHDAAARSRRWWLLRTGHGRWCAHARAARVSGALLDRSVRILVSRGHVKAWRAWREAAYYERAKKAAARRWHDQAVSRAMASLKTEHETKRRAVALGSHSASFWQSGSYGRALAAWAANAEERSRRQVRTEAAPPPV